MTTAMFAKRHLQRAAERGMSLIEVLVAVAIGLIGILIMTQAYLTSDEFNRATLGAGGAQTNGNVALFTLEREVRMAGYGINHAGALGCGNINYYYDPDYSGNLGGTMPNITLAPVVITSVAGAPPTVPDQIKIMYATGEVRSIPSSLSDTMPSASSELNVDGVDTFNINDMVLLVNDGPPKECTMVQVTQVQSAAGKLQHNPGGSAPFNPPGAGLFPAYVKDDLVFNMGNPIVRTYSIANASSLHVQEMPFSTGTGITDLDLVDGIVDLRAQYGRDTDGDGDVDVYSATFPSFPGPPTAAEWQQVIAVRVGVVARVGNYEKPTGANCDATTLNPTWQGGTFGWTDLTVVTNQARCYRYRVFETTIPIRNMIWRYV